MIFSELPKELLNRARELDDEVVADVPLVRTAKAAVDQATEEWKGRVNVSLAAKEALDSLIAQGAEAAQEVEQIAEQRRVIALDIIEGRRDACEDDALADRIARLQREIERIGWATPQYKSRYEKLNAETGRASANETEAQLRLNNERLRAKVEFMMSRR